MTTIRFHVRRSDAWRHARAVATGQSQPETVSAEIPATDLSPETRAALLGDSGRYPAEVAHLSHGRDYRPTRWATSQWDYGWESLRVDSDAPTATEIDSAVATCLAAVEAKRVAAEAEAAAKEAESVRLAAEWAALPLAWRATADGVGYCRPTDATADYRGPLAATGSAAYPRDELRRLQPAAWAEAEAESARIREIEAGRRAIADRQVLAGFLARVPQDALRGTLRAVAADPDAVARLRATIEDASPVVIFDDDDDDDDDDAE